ncbi:probable serine/threonine-protein kinase PBL19 [Tanacetum coccineum]
MGARASSVENQNAIHACIAGLLADLTEFQDASIELIHPLFCSKGWRNSRLCIPIILQTGRLTTKSDVWSFGVVPYELIKGTRAVERNLPRNEQKLLDQVKTIDEIDVIHKSWWLLHDLGASALWAAMVVTMVLATSSTSYGGVPFLQEFDTLPGQLVPEKMVEFLRETQRKDTERMLQLQILGR